MADRATDAPPAAEQSAGEKSLAAVAEGFAKVLETVAAPIGVVTGFLIFFGWTYSGAYFGHFGISHRLLQYSVRDLTLQSAQPMFGTAVLLLSVVAGLWLLDRLITEWRRRSDRLDRSADAGILVVGLVACGMGLLGALGVRPLLAVVPGRAAALVMLAGALILLRARRSTDPGRRLERALLVVASMLAVFWVTTLYATDAGRELAREVDATPARLPLVTLFSERYLDVPGTAVIATEQKSPSGTPLYRYTGLRLLTYSNDRWFLITGAQPGYRSTVTVLPDAPDVRVEVAQQR